MQQPRGHHGGLWAVFSLDLFTLGGHYYLYRWKSNFLFFAGFGSFDYKMTRTDDV